MTETTRAKEGRPATRRVPPPGSVAPTARTTERPARREEEATAAVRGNGRPSDPEEMRREIERTRARMSGTLDAIEARLIHEKEALERKKDELWAKATLQGVRRRLSEEPWRSVAIAFVAGYVVAALRD